MHHMKIYIIMNLMILTCYSRCLYFSLHTWSNFTLFNFSLTYMYYIQQRGNVGPSDRFDCYYFNIPSNLNKCQGII
jgi:hypothetical protein